MFGRSRTMKHFTSFVLTLLVLATCTPPTSVAAHRMQHHEAASSRDENVVEVVNTHTHEQRRNKEVEEGEMEDYEITNESNEVKDTISISPRSISMKPVPASLTKKQLATIKSVTEEVLMAKMPPNVISVEFYSVTEYDWQGSRRMLRNGRYLADGASTDPVSFVTFNGGEANTTLDLYYDDPTEDDLNVMMVDALLNDLLGALKKEDGFQQLTDIELAYPKPSSSVSEYGSGGPITDNSDSGSAMPAVMGILAAVCVALGAAIYARKKGHFGAMTNKYHDVRNNIRASTLRRKHKNGDGADYLVEVCMDNDEAINKATPPVTPLAKTKSLVGNVEDDGTVNIPSPKSINGSRKKMKETKPIDFSQYTVEVGED